MHYTVADLQLDTVAGTLSRDGEVLDVTGLTLAFFTALVEAAPEPLDADQLVQSVWRRDHVTDETLRKRVSLLRAAVGAELVRTLPDRRYALAVEVITPGATTDAEPRVGTEAADTPAPVSTNALFKRAMIGAAVLLVAMLGMALWSSQQGDDIPPRLVNPETGDVLEPPSH